MKKSLILGVVLLFSCLSLVQGQGPQQRDPEQRAKTTVERLKSELILTGQQEKDVAPIYTEYYTAMRKLFEAGRPSPEDRQKLTAERNEKLSKILTAEQMQKLAEIEERMRQQRRQGGGGN